MSERDELDRLIDSELARYAEPRAGLEQRMLARLADRNSPRSSLLRGWHRWVLAGSVVAAIMLFIAIPWMRNRETSVSGARTANPERGHTAKSRSAAPAAHVQAPHIPKMAKVEHTTAQIPGSKKEAASSHLPKLDVFPAPQPLSSEEQALVALSTARSDAGRENLIASQRQLSAPLQISAIDIPDITVPNVGNK